MRLSLQREVLRRKITAEFGSIEDFLEKAKDIEDSSQYNIGSRTANNISNVALTTYKPTVKTSKPMFYQMNKLSGLRQRNLTSVPCPQKTVKASNSLPHVANSMGAKEGELCCYECGQKGHIKPQCPKLKGKQ